MAKRTTADSSGPKQEPPAGGDTGPNKPPAASADKPAKAQSAKTKPLADKPEQTKADKVGKPKAKEAKAPETTPAAKTKPDQAAAKPAPEAIPEKKKRKPGVSPPLGKKRRQTLAALREEIARMGTVDVRQAVAFLKKHKRARFDETVEIHMRLGIDPKQSDQMVRGSVALPHGIGKEVRLLVFAQGENAQKAKQAGADFVGGEDLAKKIQAGWTDFDVALATPDMMGIVGRLGKILGPRGLMPSPKAGTVITGDIAQAVREFKAGKVEFRADSTGNVHAPVGKLSFDDQKLVDNIQAFVDAVRAARPAAVKGHYIRSATISASMSPGVPVAV
ncbi:MAG: 50S ribosomal protein L1 [Gemmataceae bacterium]